MAYSVEFLPTAVDDVTEAVDYIAHTLKNPSAAERLAQQVADAADALAVFPYRNPVYMPIRPLSHEFRRFTCGNYYGFYWVDEESQTVTIARILYARRNLETQLS